ncbi:DgyrCDS1648 [Dimorphilus gyrociliatus]|uniref:DgyrCDS1648 n=1 Tax=Dimorphilus gyrociliatus TaxID=2664684 RepID=A0A7I8V9T2_9ANNE|nr:DgyrCDS1648 [Dimorphilus gyrociliatus]
METSKTTISRKGSNCAICSYSWIERSPHCLPCQVAHIFCADCLVLFSKKNKLKTGDEFHCPVCRKAHIWPENGVNGFSRLPIFQDIETCEEEISTDGYSLLLPQGENGKNMEEIVLKGLERIACNKENLIESINDEESKLLLLIKKHKILLEDQIRSFFSHKENQIGELLQQIRMLDSFESGVGDDFQSETDEIRVKLKNLIDSSLGYDCFFRSFMNTDKFQFGNFSTVEDKPVGSFYIPREYQTLTCTSKSLYVLMEEKKMEDYFYKIREYGIRLQNEPADIAEWKGERADYQMAAVGRAVYVMKINGVKCLKVKKANKQLEIFFEVKNGYECKRIVSFKSGIICNGKKDNQNDIVKISDPLGVDWVATMDDKMETVEQMQVSRELLFILGSNKTVYIVLMENGNKFQEIQLSHTEVRRPLSELSNLDSLKLTIDCALFEKDSIIVLARIIKTAEKNEDFHILTFERIFTKGTVLGYFLTQTGVKFLIGQQHASNTLKIVFPKDDYEKLVKGGNGNELRKVILRGIEKVFEEKQRTRSDVNIDIEKAIEFIQKQKDFLEDRIITFYDEKESQLAELLQHIKLLESFETTIGDAFGSNVKDMWQKLTNSIDASLSRSFCIDYCYENLKFYRLIEKDAKLDESFCLNENYQSVALTEEKIYVLEEDVLSDYYLYKITEYDMDGLKKPRVIVKWKCDLEQNYDMKVTGDTLYIIEVNGFEIYKIKDFSRMIYYRCKNDKERLHDMDVTSKEVIITRYASEYNIVEMLDGAFQFKWTYRFDLDDIGDIKEMKVANDKVFLSGSRGIIRVLDVKNGKLVGDISRNKKRRNFPSSFLTDFHYFPHYILCSFETNYLTTIVAQPPASYNGIDDNDKYIDDIQLYTFPRNIFNEQLVGHFRTPTGVKFAFCHRKSRHSDLCFHHMFTPSLES